MREPLKRWEKSLIALSMALFLGALTLYVSDFPLRNYLFGLQGESGQKQVGVLSAKSGAVRRRISGDADFRALAFNAALYNDDVIVTGEESRAKLSLEDGGEIELTPNTMVRLSYETLFGMDGISRLARVEVISGQVSGKAKTHPIFVKSKNAEAPIAPLAAADPRPAAPTSPRTSPTPARPSPTPSPSPTPEISVVLLSPKTGEHQTLAKGNRSAQHLVVFEWRANQPGQTFLFSLTKNDREPVRLFERRIQTQDDHGSFRWIAHAPGNYTWEIRANDGKPIQQSQPSNQVRMARADFTIERDFEAIETLPTLIGGEDNSTNQVKDRVLRNFEFALRWKEYRGLSRYQIWLADAPNSSRPILERTVDGTEFHFNKDKVRPGAVFYRVRANLPTGFRVWSPVSKFEYRFLPPTLSLPRNQSVLKQSTLLGKGNTLLLTWQKTNFTDGYEIEIAEDPQFSQILYKKSLRENFFAFKPRGAGSYWWRVTAISKSIRSVPSLAFMVRIEP